MPHRTPPGLLFACLLALVAVGCAGDGGATGTPRGAATPGGSGQATGSPAASPAATATAAGSPAPDGAFSNPVIDANFADPFILEVDGTYYAYATGNLTFNIQVATSTDLVEWSRRREALRRLPLWQPTSKGLTWAPEVIDTEAGYVMHYTARDVESGRQCLAVAVADSPEGPFVDESEGPFLCQHDLGGSIDSSPFRDEDGTIYLTWKNDGNCCGLPTRLFIAEMSADALTMTGEPADLGLVVDAPWERPLIEAPTLHLHEGTYFLFYSASYYNTRTYAVGYATSDAVLGPYEDAPNNPVLSTRAAVGAAPGEAAGPGHQSIVVDGAGQTWMAYHAWDSALVGDQLGGRRALWLDELVLDDGTATVKGPDPGPQPAPVPP